MTLQPDVQATFAATLVDEWARAGVTDAVVSPGSRCTPLVLALARDGRIRLHVHLDERAGGFFAVGLSLGSGRPALVVTTSGTAAAELHAAVVEAHHARVPVIVCTADRPPVLHHVGAPQVIEQGGLFGASVRWAFEPGVADAAQAPAWRSLASRSVLEATGNRAGPGPVHLNLAFCDPLVAEPGPVPPGRADGAPWHIASRGERPGGFEVLGRLAGRRGVVVAGEGAGDPGAVHDMAGRLGWPVLADPRSGCRGRAGSVAAFDALLRHQPFAAANLPEVVVRLGRPPASKVLAQWLASTGAEQVVVDPHGAWPDPERTAAVLVDAGTTAFCRAVAEAAVSSDDGWRAAWTEAEAAAQEAIDTVVAGHPEPTEPGIARALTAALGPEVALFASSSMPIRDLEWYGHPAAASPVLANRGANGIDGVVSTALGLAAGRRRAAVALVGDLAFLHDSGALLWASRRPLDCVIVVVDNDGGGIFSFLPQRRLLAPATFEALLATPHGLDLAALAAVHGIATRRVDKSADLAPAVGDSLAAGGVGVVHVSTDREANVAVHAELHGAVAAALDRA